MQTIRRFSRFTLRTFLLAVAAIAAVFAVVAWFARPHAVVVISSPAVSPSGNRVAVVVTRGDDRTVEPRLWIVSVGDRISRDTRAQISGGEKPLTWSRDESQIVFVSGRFDAKPASNFRGLDSLDLQSGAVTTLEPPEISMPQYSHDGLWLGYVRGSNLLVQNIGTGERRAVRSGVSDYYWCWSYDNSSVFYIRDGLLVCQYDLASNMERILFAAPAADAEYPIHVICSPDGTLVGFHFDHWFHTVDLKSGKINQIFTCDHYFIDFDWNASGICYLDGLDGERHRKASLMVFDPIAGKSRVVAAGPFAYPRWLGDSKVLVRQGNVELWTYNVSDGSGARVIGW